MKRYVAIGTTTGHDYSFFVPIICEIWRKIGYTPLVYLVNFGDSTSGTIYPEPKHAGVVIDALNERSVVFQFMIDPVDGIQDATLAQSIRLHAAADERFGKDDLVIPSDADIIPIRKSFYYQHDTEKYKIASYYSNGYIEPGEHFPSCHISATAETWREFMEYTSSDPRQCMIETLLKYDVHKKVAAKKADPAKNWLDEWFMDEHSVTAQILKSRFYPQSFQHIERDGHPPKDRIDRSCWPAVIDASKYSDCHSLRPGWATSNWTRLRPLFEQIIPEHLQWIDPYREKFLKAMGCDQ